MPIIEKRRDFENKYFTPKLQRWLKYNAKKLGGKKNLGPIEAKVSYEKRFNLKSGIKKHQLVNLLAIRNEKTVVYKISDIDQTTRKPWDIDCYTNSMPLFAFMWHRLGNKMFYLVDPLYIDRLMKEGVASVTEADISENCIVIGHLRS